VLDLVLAEAAIVLGYASSEALSQGRASASLALTR